MIKYWAEIEKPINWAAFHLHAGYFDEFKGESYAYKLDKYRTLKAYKTEQLEETKPLFILPKEAFLNGMAQAIVDAFAKIGIRPTKAPEELAAAEAVAKERQLYIEWANKRLQEMMEKILTRGLRPSFTEGMAVHSEQLRDLHEELRDIREQFLARSFTEHARKRHPLYPDHGPKQDKVPEDNSEDIPT